MLCFFAPFAFLLFLKHKDVNQDQSWTQQKRSKIFFVFTGTQILSHTNLSLLKAYNTIHKYDILCISETYLDSSVSVDDTTLSLPGYDLVWSDHPSNIKRGVVFACIIKRINLCNQLMYHYFFSVCYVKWPFKVKKVKSLLSINLQVNQQLNLMNSYQILRIYLILLKDLNHSIIT